MSSRPTAGGSSSRARSVASSWRAYCAAALSVCALGCGDTDETNVAIPGGTLSFVSFNTALGVGLTEYLDERFAAIEQSLPDLGADVVCLQEVWQPEMIDGLAEGLKSEFPHAFWSVRAANGGVSAGGGACSQEEAGLLSDCLATHCASAEGTELALCAVANCQDEFGGVSSECQECIFANQTSAVEGLAAICAGQAGDAVAYEDQNGLLLLSRYPLTGRGFLELDSSFGERGVLAARVSSEALGDVDVFCTHLAATLGDVTYDGRFGSWEGEREHQIGQLLEFVAERTSGARAVLGDMNCGPMTAQARAAGADAFALFTRADFVSPYAEQEGRCTWCADNPLTGGSAPGDVGAILDHVLLAGFPAGLETSARRVFDDSVPVAGSSAQTTRSDHYGVGVSLGAPASDSGVR